MSLNYSRLKEGVILDSATIIKITVNPTFTSIKEGEQVDFRIMCDKLAEFDSISINISKVDADYTDFSLGYGTPIPKLGNDVTIICPPTKGLKEGLYMVSAINLQKESKELGDEEIAMPEIIQTKFDRCFFEIRVSSKEHTPQELVEIYNNIIKGREEKFISGFGEKANRLGQICKEYRSLVFIKDCLITRRMIIGQYEIFPFEGLACNDELGLVQDFLIGNGIPPLDNTDETLLRAKQGQPTAIVHFPKVFASSVEEAGCIVENEIRILCDLLSIYRTSYASIFSIIIIDIPTGAISFKILTPSYTGNLIGGSIAGEVPKEIRDRMVKVRQNKSLQLYLMLFSEALKERSREIAYFRYWNLLETIARSKNYIGGIMYDWQNNVMLNKHGKQRKIQDDAIQQVTELLRRIFKLNNLSASSSCACGLTQGHIKEQIAIWYRHRNCMVHCGGCFPDDSIYCNRVEDKFVNCKRAYDEILTKHGCCEIFEDQYLRNLRDIVRDVISNEVNGAIY